MAAISSAQFSSNQYLALAMTGAVNLRASHTMAVRVKHSSTATNTDNICLGYLGTTVNFNDQGSGVGRNNGITSTGLNVYRINDSFSPTADAATRSTCYGNTTTWYHLCFVYNASTQQIRFYIDGTFIAQHASNTTRTSSSTSNTFNTARAPGKFADACLWDRALSDSEVLELATYRVPQQTSGLVLFWRLDSNANDSSGNGRNGNTAGSGTAITYSVADNPPQAENPTVDLAGGATSASTLSGSLTKIFAVSGAPTTASTLAGTLGVAKPIAAAATSASSLAGDLRLGKQLAAAASTSSQLAAWLRPRWGRRIENGLPTLSASGGTVPSDGPMTFMAWVRVVSAPTPAGDAVICYINEGSGQAQLGWGVVSGTPRLRFAVWDSGGTQRINSSSATTDNNWHHLAIAFDGVSTVECYIDGSSVATSSAMAMSANAWSDIAIGSITAGVGEVAHVKLWAERLTAAEIVQEKDFYTPSHHNTKLYAWWQLGWQNAELDSSGNGHSLTNNGSTEAQSEAPGLPLTDLASAATSASTLAGTLSQAQPLVGAPTTASTLAGTLTQQQPLVGASSSASSLAGTLSQAQPLAGAPSTASTLAGTLSQAQPLTAAATSASSLTGFLDVSVPLAAAASTATTLTGTLGVHRPIAGAMSTGSTLTGALGIEGAFSGNALTASTLAGTLSVDKPVAGAASTASTLTGILSQLQPLGAAAQTNSTLSGAITVIKQAEGGATTASSLSGALSVAVALVAAPSTASTLAGTLSLTQQLAAAAQSSSHLTGVLTVQNVLTGAASTTSKLLGTLSVDIIWQLAAAARTASTLSGSLTVNVPASARAGVATDGRATAYYGPATIRSPGIRRPWPPRPS
jgi:hypothetical protein